MRSLELFISDIAEEIDNVEKFSKNLSDGKFISSGLHHNAIIRSLEIIGEAVKNIPESFRKKYPEVQWKQIAGFRDRTIHSYFRVDLDVTWDIVKRDIPVLRSQIEKIMKDLLSEKKQ